MTEICAKIPKDLGEPSEPGPFLKGLLAAVKSGLKVGGKRVREVTVGQFIEFIRTGREP
jgi:hypothetical protein